ncbi:Rhodanese-like domain [Ostreococcus tauri]|uniref:Rhodanese-like domain n=1 Tax=Ostreococcus tauri TaxID=70448 RepID=Q018B9_OSTTA|nr:Rhodanese-like domain [Ostreococcus tauri]OUS47731.1 hypothetical protein BE221DRAFT_203844 [Ostreococcus tauri]CAL54256.1 Rhodanese-like domain [Ostreococcus tauri]|eukprot:XP_003079598.1 Rhodanese-like domain [Ostreococcus tauri]
MSFALSSKTAVRSTAVKFTAAKRSNKVSRVVRADATAEADIATAMVPVDQVKDFLGRGFVIVDIRSPEEWAEGSKNTWKKICLAIFDEETGEVEMNPSFMAQIKAEFPNTLSRILLVCDDGTERSEIAWRGISKRGYTQCKIIEGGSEAFFKAFPLTAADKRVWKLQDQPGADLSTLVSGVSMNMDHIFQDRKY